MNRNLKNPFGWLHGKLVHVSEVDTGIQCGCICPSCKSPLIAKKGDRKIHHFAHSNKTNKCIHHYETDLHKWAKEQIMKESFLMVPGHKFLDDEGSIKEKSPYIIEFSRVDLEKSHKNIRPDLTCYTESGDMIFVEIFVSHKVGERKAKRIAKKRIATIEIDFSNIDDNFDINELKNLLFASGVQSTWIYNKESEIAENEDQARAIKRNREARERQQKLNEDLIRESKIKTQSSLDIQKVQSKNIPIKLINEVKTSQIPEIVKSKSKTNFVYPRFLSCRYCGETTEWIIFYTGEYKGVCKPCLSFHNSSEEIEKRWKSHRIS